MRKLYTRKEFIRISASGMAVTGLIVNNLPVLALPKKPERVTLGETGFNITPLCFGASRAQTPAVLVAALEKGMNFIDTGRQYGHGRNEEMIGKVLSSYPEKIIVQTKVKVDIPERGKALYTRKAKSRIRDTMQRSLEESLKALRRDCLDIWLCHGPEREEILFHDEVMTFFEKVKSQGLIKAHGFSAHSNQPRFLKRANSLKFFDVIMVGYNHKGSMVHSLTGIYRKFDNEEMEKELKIAHDRGVGTIAMKTCSGGPFSPDPATEPSFPHAVRWALQKPFIDAAAVAMANFDEISQHASFLS